jgi:hypothetical protein
MPGNVRIHKSTLMNQVSNQRVNHSLQEQGKAANLPLRRQRTPAVIREPVNSIERAMDIAIGAEPWDEDKAA